MSRLLCKLLLCTLVPLVVTGICSVARSAKFTPIKDLQIYQKSPDSNFNWDALEIGDHGATAEEARTLMEINTTGMSGLVESATLNMYMYLWSDHTIRPAVDVHRLTGPWVETTATWNAAGPNPWFNEGGDYASHIVDTTTVGNSTGTWYQWDIKELVQDWIDGTHPNYGLLLKARSNEANSWKKFNSREYSTLSRRPYVDITLGVGGIYPEPSTLSMLSFGGLGLLPSLRRRRSP